MSQSTLILHGWGGSSKSWQKVKEILEKENFKVYNPDLPGFGQEPDPKTAWGVGDYVEWVRDFCEKNNLSQIFLLGHSFGGRIATKFAVQYPEKIKGLLLVDSAGFGREKSLGLRQKISIKLRKIGYFFVMLPFLKNLYPFFRKIAYIFAGTRDYYLIKNPVMKETFKKVIAEDITPYLSQIKSKVLIIWGEKDKLVPLKIAYLIEEKISDSQLKIIPNIGHNPHLEAPEKLSEIIIKSLN